MMVIFLVGLVSMILMRTLKKDYARYSKEDDVDDMERDLGDEYGWKQVSSWDLRTLHLNENELVCSWYCDITRFILQVQAVHINSFAYV